MIQDLLERLHTENRPRRIDIVHQRLDLLKQAPRISVRADHIFRIGPAGRHDAHVNVGNRRGIQGILAHIAGDADDFGRWPFRIFETSNMAPHQVLIFAVQVGEPPVHECLWATIGNGAKVRARLAGK